MLVISVPGLTWEDVNRNEVPNLVRLFDRSAVGDLATRTVSRHATLADGYVTLGAGTRAIGAGDAVDGEGFAVDEAVGDDIAGQIFERRTGTDPARGLVHLGFPAIVEANAGELYDAEVGALGDALAGAGFSRAVIANADGQDTAGGDRDTRGYYRRTAVAALMGSGGRVPGGSVGSELLVDDVAAPFGLRYDDGAVLEAFRAVWEPRSVVLVEASDLVRQDFYRGFATAPERARLFRQSLQATDELVGALLEEVDLSRDIVLVVGSSHPRAAPRLTVVALHEPGEEPGLLHSGATKRAGFVQLVDIAPTILDRLDIDEPGSMEGGPVGVDHGGGSGLDRREFLADADEAARFRDDHVGPVTTLFVVLEIALGVGVIVSTLVPSWRWLPRVLVAGALGVLGLVPAVLLARLVAFHDLGTGPYFAFLVVVAAALSFLYQGVGRRHPAGAVMAGLGVIILVLVVDVLLGAPLQFNSPLGYSPKVAGRFGGFGNLGYAALASATVLLAGLLAHRISGRRGAWVAIGLLAGVFLVDATPRWGSDVGGILSMLPAFTITAVLLLGLRVRVRTFVASAGAAVAALLLFGLLDLALPANPTHLGRLLERIGDEGWSSLATVLLRKADQNLSVLFSSVWLFTVPIVVGIVGWLLWQAPERLRALSERFPEGRPALVGFAVVAVLGFALNDSGIATPGVMLAVLVAALVALLAEDALRPPEQRGGRAPEPARWVRS
ncbi:MAG TPA: hypothetical protein VMQ81_05255 [Acidimicrobiia bacterium]|nr:hypothetical protein [Acidimicrobiia bacterium]